MRKKINNFKTYSNLIKLFVFTIIVSSTALVSAQSTCNFDQELSLLRGIDDCGDGGILGVDLVNGEAPYTVSLRDMFGDDSTGGVTNSSNFRIRVFPGTFELKTIDANGCEDINVFEIYADNFVVEKLDCLANGRRAVRLSNNSTSSLPVRVSIGGFGFSLNAGASSTFNVNPGNYTFRVTRPGCSPYNVSIGVDACATTAKSSKSSEASSTRKLEIIDNLATSKAKLYPNPFSDNIVIDLNETQKTVNAEVLVYDINGRLVHQNNIKDSKSTINLEDQVTGAYFVKVIDAANGEKLIEKQVIKK
ncbi:T9SS type A sorting domain-containing protein [uncultured Algibacter sp.]|uniref:T9SS type A sorting domain-containing protein n=1 Tax=uncultured Algibacter sp. TaxID=298659 RepID=UPI003216CE88